MQLRTGTVGAAIAAAIAAGLGFALFRNKAAELAFDTIRREGAFSVRNYPQLLVVETIEAGPRESALSRGFTALADFFGARGRIPVAAPVLADGDDDGRGWRTRFVIPHRFQAETLPEPVDGVAIRTLEPRKLAAIRFNGEADDSTLARHETDLRGWMAANGYRPAGPVEHAYYSSPLMPAPLKRNEVLIPLAA